MASDLIERNPALKKPALALLSLCVRASDEERTAIEAAAEAIWDGAYRLSPAAMVDVLVRGGMLEEQMLLNGEPYEGSIDDMQLDPEVDEGSVVESTLFITDAGCRLLDEYAARNTLNDLFARKPHYLPVFKAAIGACADGAGCGRADLERAIDAVLPKEDGEGGRRVYAQYFIDALETAGGIEWNGAWRATDAGLETLKG